MAHCLLCTKNPLNPFSPFVWNQAFHCESQSLLICKIYKIIYLQNIWSCNIYVIALLPPRMCCCNTFFFFFQSVPPILWFGLFSEPSLKFLATLCLKWLSVQFHSLAFCLLLCYLKILFVLILTTLKTA